MPKDTEKLIHELKETTSIADFLSDNEQNFDNALFSKTLAEWMAQRGLNTQALINQTYLSGSYVYDLLGQKKKPSRDTVIKLAFALSLGPDDTNRLLKLAGWGELYPRVERDAIVLFCLNKGHGLLEADELLGNLGEVGLVAVG